MRITQLILSTFGECDLFCALGVSTFRLDSPGLGIRMPLPDELRGLHSGEHLDFAECARERLGLIAPACSVRGGAALECPAGLAVAAGSELLILGKLLSHDLACCCPCVVCLAFRVNHSGVLVGLLLRDRPRPYCEAFRGVWHGAPSLLHVCLEAFARAVCVVAGARGGAASEPTRLPVGALRIPRLLLRGEESIPIGHCRVHAWGVDFLADLPRVFLSGSHRRRTLLAFGRVRLP